MLCCGNCQNCTHMPAKLPALTAVSLVRKGYFPRDLPHPFSTDKLANLLHRAPAALPRSGGTTECVRHNLARPGGFRRPLRVPNPRSFIELADEIETQWPQIYAHVHADTLSMSRPVVTRTKERAVAPRYKFGEQERLRPRHWRGQRFILRTDVNQFYSSLYTHAIPWALEGKQYSKRRRGQTKADRIDKALRNLSDGQTMGVPIGPDTSFLAAEIVMAAVDQTLSVRMKPKPRGHRYIDDYELAFPSRAAAEEAQALIEDALAEYELAINPAKTVVLELPQPFQETWTHELATFSIRSDKSSQTLTDLIALFSRAAGMARRLSGPLKYALLRSRAANITDRDIWRPFQNLIWSAVSAEPTTMATALDVLAEKATATGFAVDKRAATEVVEALIHTHSPVKNASEVAWGLWAAIALEVKLSKAAAKAVVGMEDDFVALLALHADSLGLFRAGTLDKSGWEALTDFDDVLSGPHWLLAYEATARTWLSSARSRVSKDPFFKVLRARKVRFYDTKPSRNPFTGPAGPLPGGTVPDEYA
jgi:Reverse transcriptase (RNA-dependent DNA polymerase)